MRLAGKISVITGAGSGIGRATALLFAREGAKVVVTDRAAEAAERVADEAAALDAEYLALAVDVADGAACRWMIEATVDRFGGLDVLVNNAGYGITGDVVETSEADWDDLIATNLKGVFLCSKHAIPIMRRQGGGAIVNTASVVANIGIRDRAAYCASKGGVQALTRAMAVDHAADGIRVNCVAPGTIDSPYFERIMAKAEDGEALRRQLQDRQLMRRLGTPEEVARAILYLASDEASFCTGSTLTADGGMSAY